MFSVFQGHSALVNRRQSYHGTKTHSAFLVVLVITGPKYFERRTTIRETWMSDERKDVILLFSIGTAGLGREEISTLEYENNQHNDLLLLKNFQDSYFNLTAKVVESFKWVDKNVKTEFIFKADDDTFARMDIIYDELRGKEGTKRLYWGFFDGRARVKQSGQWAEKRWHLCDTYLPHARGGGYILSADLVHYIAKNSKYLQMFNSEDVSVGAWLGPLEVTRVHDPRFDTEYMSRGCVNEYIVTHKQDVQAMRSKFENLQKTGKLCTKEYKSRYSYIYNWNVPTSMCCMRNDSSVP